VLDTTNEIGSFCGKVLGDLGADVIKVEPPGGDPARRRGPFYRDIEAPEHSLPWWFGNLNKRGITLDLKTENGRTRFRDLVKTAAFVLESFEPGYLAGRGLGYEDLQKIRPDLIMTSITPFGQTGPYAQYQAADLILVSMGGMAQLYGDPDRPPVRISVPQAYSLGAIHGVLGSVVTHYHRTNTGIGQHVDVSCQQAVTRTLMIAAEYWDILKVDYKRQGPGSVSARPEPLGPLVTRRIFQCRDGYVYALIAGGAQAGFVASSKAMTRMANQEGYALELKDYDWTGLDVSRTAQEEYDRVQDAFGEYFLAKTKQELFEQAIEHSILLVPISDVTDIMKCRQLGQRKFFVDVAHPELNRSITYPGFPVRIDEFDYAPQRRPPLIGEHSEEIASEANQPKEILKTSQPPDEHIKIIESEPRQVFEGIKVADFSWVAAGPQVGRELAGHGATVVRVESHKRPDTLRLVTPFKDGIPGIDRSAFGMAFNTNKLGMSLDMTHPKGREIARRLVEWADLVSDSMTPGSMKKIGLDYESCRKIKPDIIYYSTCQMGQHGPLSTFSGYGAFGAAYGGFSHLTGWPDRMPTPLFKNYSDFIAPWYLTSVVVLALDHRKRTGKGLYLDQAQIEAGITFLAPAVLDYVINGWVAVRQGNRDPYMAPHGIFPCKGDDEWAAIAVRNDREWATFCDVADKPEWSADSRFAIISKRKQNEEELERLIGLWSVKHTPGEVMEMLQEAGIPAGVVATSRDFFEDPQLAHRRHFRFLEHGAVGTAAHNAPAHILSKTPNDIQKAGPCLGEDNEYVYKELFGYTDEQIAEFLVEGVITTEYDVPDVLKQK
jgi:crotonobetainyl-CoA:carnitine CoA-transferase CaiB-like acyl-CoA transferase